MPREWPRHTVAAVVARKSTKAPQVNSIGPPSSAARVMLVIHSDLLGLQDTEPETASLPSASRIRTVRKVPSDFCKAASTGSKGAHAAGAGGSMKISRSLD